MRLMEIAQPVQRLGDFAKVEISEELERAIKTHPDNSIVNGVLFYHGSDRFGRGWYCNKSGRKFLKDFKKSLRPKTKPLDPDVKTRERNEKIAATGFAPSFKIAELIKEHFPLYPLIKIHSAGFKDNIRNGVLRFLTNPDRDKSKDKEICAVYLESRLRHRHTAYEKILDFEVEEAKKRFLESDAQSLYEARRVAQLKARDRVEPEMIKLRELYGL